MFLISRDWCWKCRHCIRSFAPIAKACASIITDCDVTAHSVNRKFEDLQKTGQENPYFRLTVKNGLGNIRLDDWREKESLVGITKTYMRSDDSKALIKRLVNILSNVREEDKGDDKRDAKREEMEGEMEPLR